MYMKLDNFVMSNNLIIRIFSQHLSMYFYFSGLDDSQIEHGLINKRRSSL